LTFQRNKKLAQAKKPKLGGMFDALDEEDSDSSDDDRDS
jgi:hypothetical protein